MACSSKLKIETQFAIYLLYSFMLMFSVMAILKVHNFYLKKYFLLFFYVCNSFLILIRLEKMLDVCSGLSEIIDNIFSIFLCLSAI